MPLIDLISFAAVVTLLVISPGPNGLLIAKTVPSSGAGAGFANIFGFVAAFYLHGSLSILGISLILLHSAEAFLLIKLLGAGYLCWLGVNALYQAYRGQSIVPTAVVKTTVSYPKALLEGFLTNALNPKVSMFYVAAFSQFIPPDGGAAVAYVLVTLHALINVIWFSLMIVLLHRLGQFRRSPQTQRWLKSVTGFAFLGFAAKLAWLKQSP